MHESFLKPSFFTDCNKWDDDDYCKFVGDADDYCDGDEAFLKNNKMKINLHKMFWSLKLNSVKTLF